MGLGMRAIVRVRVYLKREAWGQFTANTERVVRETTLLITGGH